jgi:hypothetical protein
MKKYITTFLIAGSLFLVSCASKKSAYDSLYAGVTTKAQSASDSIAAATADGKTVKRLQYEAMSLLDQLDYKAVILLNK